MKLALVFPPALHPTSPPLGLACLAAWLRREVDGLQLRLFDLNLAYFQQALDWMRQGRLRLSFKDQTPEQTLAQVEAALAVLTSGAPDFYQPVSYQKAAAIYLRLENLLNPIFAAQSRRLAQGLPPGGGSGPFLAELLRPLQEWAPDLLGLSALFSQQLPWALGLARAMKDATGARVVLGGATLSVMSQPERLLAGPLAAELGQGLDWLLPGEGELGLAELARQLMAPSPELERVPGLLWLEDGAPRANPPQAVEDLSFLPLPDFSDFPLGQYHSPALVLPYLGARGCWWRKCAYCTHRQTYLRYREEPAELCAQRMAQLARLHGCRHFSLVDEMIHPRRAAALCAELTRLGADLRWAAYARPQAGFSPELLKAMHGAGCRVLLWGVESGSQRVLDSMNKGTRVEVVGRVLDDAAAAGIQNLAFVMFGFPGESEDELEQTLAFLEQHRGSIAALSKSRFLLLEGAPMLGDPGRYGISRVLPRGGDPLLGLAYDYEVVSGLSQARADELYRQRLRGLTLGGAPELAILRDHMLLRVG